MQTVPIHTGTFIAAVIVKIVVGALWYSRLLFLEPWQRMSGVTGGESESKKAASYAASCMDRAR